LRVLYLGHDGSIVVDDTIFSNLSAIKGLNTLFFKNSPCSLILKFPPDVTSIGDDFLSSCSGLTELDLSPLLKIISIGAYFLADCAHLTTVKVARAQLLLKENTESVREIKWRLPKHIQIIEA